jgi:ATP-binding cassette subfamily C (CFTR/MRP) protein 1
LVSTDVDSLVTTAEMFHETWAQLVEVVIGMILLTRKVGWISPILLLSIFGLYNAWDFA